VEVDPDGRALARATAHQGYQSCKFPSCHDKWMPVTGWTRVSTGSHAGHIPVVATQAGPHRPFGSAPTQMRERPAIQGIDVQERTTTAAGLRLVPIEQVNTAGLKFDGITPPWRKGVYRQPHSNSTS
jgi:hypothetical protein